MKKYLAIFFLIIINPLFAEVCPPSMLELCDYTHGTFYHLDNQLGVNILGSYTQGTLTNSQNNSTGTAGGIEGYWDFLLPSGFWFSNRINYVNYFGANNFADDQANYTLKFGYGFQPVYDYWEITPYLVADAGAGQLQWDSQINYGGGVGLRTEVALVTRNSIYADYNIQYLADFGNFANSYNQQFGTANAFVSSIPYGQNIEIGYKHVFNCNWNMQVFYRYTTDNINYTFGGTAPNQNYSNTSNMLGVGVSWYMGG